MINRLVPKDINETKGADETKEINETDLKESFTTQATHQQMD